eukprot:2965918-Prymnesium_polylepis.1
MDFGAFKFRGHFLHVLTVVYPKGVDRQWGVAISGAVLLPAARTCRQVLRGACAAPRRVVE